MPRRNQIYKITYPNGKIYVGMDLTGSVLYVGSPIQVGVDANPAIGKAVNTEDDDWDF